MVNQMEIARKTGFSRQTVSLAVNHPHKLDPKTLATIQKAIEESGYVPNQAARNFQKGRTRILGMVFRLFSDQDFSNPFLFETLRGLHQSASAAGYGIRFQPIEHIQDIEKLYRSKAFDGFIYMTFQPEQDKEFFKQLHSKQVPLVVFGQGQNFPWVDMDYRQGSTLAFNKLLEKGRKNIVYLGGGLDQDFNREKWKGFQKAAKTNKIQLQEKNVFHNCWTIAHGQEAIEQLIKNREPVDGIFAADGDMAALGALRALKIHGFKVPEDVSLLAGDGSVYCQSTIPVLSAISAPYAQRAEEGVKMLIQFLEGNTPPDPKLLPFSFFSGNSL